jgi:hypothetical protein
MKMTHQVFLQLPLGGRLWVASATSLEQASEYWRTFDSTSPETYLIVDARSRRLVEASEAKSAEWTLTRNLKSDLNAFTAAFHRLLHPRLIQLSLDS